MIRKIIKIDEEKCNGCGACAAACHEGAIEMVNGKARLTREDYCDGLGDCLPACPVDAISFEEREAPAYDEAAVLAAKTKKKDALPCGCPGTHAKAIKKRDSIPTPTPITAPVSQLSQWPVQIKLVPVNAPYFEGANLLIAADCTAYAYANFHNEFIRNRITLIGCPKLDEGDYAEKLTAILKNNEIKSVTVVRM
ncbi:MAG: 4Fe-4S binding protein [Clostridia bacterium]|nr:4Fe-4S binding protein [Clostridia bacterium]